MSDPALQNSAHESDDLSGRRLGDYQLLRRLGKGGMAEVYLADQDSLGRKVAFKVLRGPLAMDENYIRRFLNEARAAASLVHANIVQVYEVNRVDGVYFIAQEYVAGQNLRQLLTRDGPLEVKSALNIMRQVASALFKAGQQGIVHRDIKPDNILLNATGEAKVADFGLARITNRDTNHMTQVGVTMGTPLYMSPEQVEGRDVDPRSDLYSFGVTSYHMLAGRAPFEGDTPLNIAVQHLKTPPRRLEELRPDLPQGLCRIVHRLLEKEPSARYQDAAELLRDLRALQIEGVEAAWPTGIEEWTTTELLAIHTARATATRQLDALMKQSVTSSPRRSLLLWGLLAALGFVVGAAFAYAFRPQPLLDSLVANRSPIERKESVRQQYFFALTLGTEPALQSVAKFFPADPKTPDNERYARLADQRLAELYLDRGDNASAYLLYEKLVATADSTDLLLKVSGLLSQANILHRQAKTEHAHRKLAEAAPLYAKLRDSDRTNLPAVDNPLKEEWARLQREVRPDREVPPDRSRPRQPAPRVEK